MRNSGFTCGTRWNPGRCRTQPIHDGSWGSHTQARDAAFTGTRQTPPPTTATFPRNKAKKSPCYQHDLSILQVGSHQLQHQLSRINKPKSHHKTNTFCPVTRKTPPAPVRRLPEGQAAMPAGGVRAWPDNEPTRRAKLAARTARGRAAAHGHTKQPGRDSGRVRGPARGTRSHVRPQLGTPRPTARSPAHSAQASYIDKSAHPRRGGRF